jgi:hypothetical protein
MRSIRLAVVALAIAVLFSVGAHAASALNYGDSYGYVSVNKTTTAGVYYASATDLKADGRRFCGQFGTSTLSSVVTYCDTTSTNAPAYRLSSGQLYWFRLCHQTYANVPPTDMRYTALTCTPWQRVQLSAVW